MKQPIDYLRRYVTTGDDHDAAQRECRDHGPFIFRQARKDLGLTLRQLAAKMGVSYTSLSRVENDHMFPGDPMLRSLYAVLDGKPVKGRKTPKKKGAR
jgi:ribosome-binding protein aMBF1 (putative translation factor)